MPTTDIFEQLDQLLTTTNGPQAALSHVADLCLTEKNYALLFETRLMAKRHELGLPLIQTQHDPTPPQEIQQQYEQFMVDTAREVGTLFLNNDQIERAWPYFRAINETAAIQAAIEKAEPHREDIEAVIEIAFQQGLHPAKGLDLVLRQYGMCRAITLFGMYGAQSATAKQDCINLLTKALYEELTANLRYTIGQKEQETPPQDTAIPQLLENRDWLFGEYDYYVDTSHLNSVVQYATEAEDNHTLGLIEELCHYGRKLAPTLHLRGNPPFDNPFEDYGIYAQARQGRQVEEAIQHFKTKMEEGDPQEIIPAQVLIQLLLKLGRTKEALKVSLERLSEVPAAHLSCPTTLQLAHQTGDYAILKELAREKQDALTYIAATQ